MTTCQTNENIQEPSPSESWAVNLKRPPSKAHLALMAASEEDRKRFWNHVSKESHEKGCWIWTGVTRPNNRAVRYGCQFIHGEGISAHRVSFFIHNGAINPDLQICHKCDNPICVNPDHLFEGTGKDNMRDCSEKGRVRGMEKTHCPKGHPYTPENTRRDKETINGRKCIICIREKDRRYYQSKKLKAKNGNH